MRSLFIAFILMFTVSVMAFGHGIHYDRTSHQQEMPHIYAVSKTELDDSEVEAEDLVTQFIGETVLYPVRDYSYYGSAVAFIPHDDFEAVGHIKGLLPNQVVLGENTDEDVWELWVKESGKGSGVIRSSAAANHGEVHYFEKLSKDKELTVAEKARLNSTINDYGFNTVGAFEIPVLYPDVVFIVADSIHFYTLTITTQEHMSVGKVADNTNTVSARYCEGSRWGSREPCVFKIKAGEEIEIVASADPDRSPNRILRAWLNDCSGTSAASACTITMNSNKSVSASWGNRPTQ